MAEVLLHIGYPKTGSNFIYSYFRNNPKMVIVGDNLKRHYIQSGEILPVLRDEMPTEKHYVIGEEQLSVWRGRTDIVGVRFISYDIKAHQTKTCEGLHTTFPNAKILIVTRGFESAFRSMYWQYVSIGGILNFRKFQKEYSNYLADFYDYDFLIAIYKKHFGEKVTVLPYELLQQDVGKFLPLMEERCGLPHFVYNSEKINASMPEKIESYQKLSAVLYRLVQPFPYSMQQKLYGAYVEALHKGKLRWLPTLGSNGQQLHIEDSTMRLFSGKSTALQHDPLFQPYLKEYLISA